MIGTQKRLAEDTGKICWKMRNVIIHTLDWYNKGKGIFLAHWLFLHIPQYPMRKDLNGLLVAMGERGFFLLWIAQMSLSLACKKIKHQSVGIYDMI